MTSSIPQQLHQVLSMALEAKPTSFLTDTAIRTEFFNLRGEYGFSTFTRGQATLYVFEPDAGWYNIFVVRPDSVSMVTIDWMMQGPGVLPETVSVTFARRLAALA